ncbi:hypothetical protein CI109_105038 [Kwoniella shandongensis]|uniref:Uncharacterized protein n=1 Tax=Kwoniella shandongensis TaxID=1734106 RepID=A0A5M6BX61_9TREE|nr:uncharacterized protein CI109_004363 [Kwoniella shandongensis]KAA5527303.1 hypothetical protein CI109_004363 [Kwoniella shandongensis]
MRVAVIGSGLAGLTTAYFLRRQGVEVWLIEKSPKLGFHSQSVDVTPQEVDEKEDVKGNATGSHSRNSEDEKDDSRWIVDVPMRGFQGGYYPLLLSLYSHLGIPFRRTNYTYSFTSSSTYFIHSGSSGFSIPSLPSSAYTSPFAFIHHLLSFLGVALCYILLVVLSFMAWHDVLPPSLTENDLTLREFTTNLTAFLARPIAIPLIGYSPWTPLGEVFESFVGTIVLPLFSAVGTMTSSDVWSVPVRVVLDYIHQTLGTDHYHFDKGYSAADVASRLSAPVKAQGKDYVRVGTEITGLEYAIGGGVRVKLRTVSASTEDGGEEEGLRVDKVVLATQASVAKMLLSGLEKSLKEWGEEKEKVKVGVMRNALGKVQYRETIVITHRDTSILPPIANRRDINLFLPPASASSSSSRRTKSPSSPSLPSNHNLSQHTASTPLFDPSEKGIYTMATQIIQSPRGDLEPVLQTTNPVIPINPNKVLSISRLERALPLKRPTETIHALRPNSPNSLVYLVGSYAYPGIPLLEGCVGSAKLAVENILASDKAAREKVAKLDGSAKKEKKRVGWFAWQRGGLGVGDVDWDVGRGSRIVRIWRWRRKEQ